MKSIIIYYSMSGNTKKIAEAIHKGMEKTGEQCEIARLGDVDLSKLADYDLIGLGSPVIGFKEMPNITSFIKNNLKCVKSKHGFAFCTHGASPANYLLRVVPAMMRKGLTMIGWNDWFCSVVFPVAPIPYFTEGHPDEIDLKEAQDFGKEMVKLSRRIYNGEKNLIPRFPRGSKYNEIYNPKLPELPERLWKELFAVLRNNELKLNKKKCRYPKCTHCIDNCPRSTIDLSLPVPVFCNGWDKCWLCEQTCPNGAIEFDYVPLQKAHDPFTTQLLQKALEEFEAQGRFRRLVPLKEIGWDTPFWKLKKPRFKIEGPVRRWDLEL